MCLTGRAESPDVFTWKYRPCNTRVSVRTGSFFAKCGLSTQKMVMMMYYWIYEVKLKHVMLFEEIDSWDTMVNYNKLLSFGVP